MTVDLFTHPAPFCGRGPTLDILPALYDRTLIALRERMVDGAVHTWTCGHLGDPHHDISRPAKDALDVAAQYNTSTEHPGVVRDIELKLVNAVCGEIFGYDHVKCWGYACTDRSVGNLVGLWIARDRARATGRPSARVVFASADACRSVARACRILDLELRAVPADGPMRTPTADDLRGADALAVVATIGTSYTGSVDDVVGIRRVVAESGLPVWVHADAAYGGYFAYVAGCIPSLRDCDSAVVDVGQCGYGPRGVAVVGVRNGVDTWHACGTDADPWMPVIEDDRAGASIIAAWHSHEQIRGMYPTLMANLLRGADALTRAIVAKGHVIVGPCGLSVVRFAFRPEERMPYYATRFCDSANTRHGGIALTTTTVAGRVLFRIVVMDPSFPSYAQNVADWLETTRVHYDRSMKV
ncbi:MAG: pyridoxal-dependent decarboxylase [Candidatus Omnitrophota bacterium]